MEGCSLALVERSFEIDTVLYLCSNCVGVCRRRDRDDAWRNICVEGNSRARVGIIWRS